MVFAMGEAMIFVVDSDEAVGQCDDEDMRKLEALAANKNDETAATTTTIVAEDSSLCSELSEHKPEQELHDKITDEGRKKLL